MASARQDYVAPWWTYWLHNFPHRNFHFQAVDTAFKPAELNYQQSLIFLACTAAVGLALSLLMLGFYLSCLCYWSRKEAEETKRPETCCVTWAAVITGLVICSAVGVGFYGNSETNDGVYQMTYSLSSSNHTLASIDSQVSGSLSNMRLRLKEHLARLDEIFSPRQDYTQAVRFMQQMADNIIRQLAAMPNITQARQDLARVAEQASYMEYYRWLMYLLLLILDLVICLGCCLGLVKHSRWLLAVVMVLGMLTLTLSWASVGVGTATAVGASDFCVAPDKFIVNQTKNFLKKDVAHYYLYCSQTLPNPFQQSLTIFQRSLTTMQIQVQGLLQISVSIFPTAERDLLGIQGLLNTTEISLHQLTASLDCRSLHKVKSTLSHTVSGSYIVVESEKKASASVCVCVCVCVFIWQDYLDALVGLCYDGVEGLLYLCLFSLLAACAFCSMLCTIPRAYFLMASRDRNYDDIDEEDPFNPRSQCMAPYSTSRANVHSFCSYSSSLGSQISLQPPVPAATTAPPPEYMNQAMLFAGNPRYENVPLIGRGSPPPSYSPSMRTTFLSMTDAQLQHYGNDYHV